MITSEVFRKANALFYFVKRYKSGIQTKSSIDYCVDLIKNNDNENFLCTLLLPKEERNAAIAVRAFNVEVSRAAAASKDQRIALMRLTFWRETIDRIYAGNPPNQPVALELARAVSKYDIKKRNLLRLVKAREVQLTEPCFSSLSQMEAYCEETVSPIIYITLEAAGVKDVNADHVASHIGKGQGLSQMLRIAGSGPNTWCLPRDLFESSGLDVSDGLSPNSDLSKDVVLKIATRSKSHIEKARSLKSRLPKGCTAHFLPAIATYNYLKRLSDADFNVFEPFLKERDARLGLSLLWAKLINKY